MYVYFKVYGIGCEFCIGVIVIIDEAVFLTTEEYKERLLTASPGILEMMEAEKIIQMRIRECASKDGLIQDEAWMKKL